MLDLGIWGSRQRSGREVLLRNGQPKGSGSPEARQRTRGGRGWKSLGPAGQRACGDETAQPGGLRKSARGILGVGEGPCP